MFNLGTSKKSDGLVGGNRGGSWIDDSILLICPRKDAELGVRVPSVVTNEILDEQLDSPIPIGEGLLFVGDLVPLLEKGLLQLRHLYCESSLESNSPFAISNG